MDNKQTHTHMMLFMSEHLDEWLITDKDILPEGIHSFSLQPLILKIEKLRSLDTDNRNLSLCENSICVTVSVCEHSCPTAFHEPICQSHISAAFDDCACKEMHYMLTFETVHKILFHANTKP